MIKLAEFNILTIGDKTGTGLELTDENNNKVILPRKEIEPEFKKGDKIEVFVYSGTNNQLFGTCHEPNLLCGQFGYLKVKEINTQGAFLDWGIDKDLFVPFYEQNSKMLINKTYLVYLTVDEKTNRQIASSKINRFFLSDTSEIKPKQQVDVLICDENENGYKIIADNKFRGMIYHNEIFKPIKTGQHLIGFVNRIREDGKLDIQLDKSGKGRVDPGADKIIELLMANNGFIKLNDNSSPDEIKKHLQMSKKTFKKAIGALYKLRQIKITDEGIYLIKE